LNPVQTDIRIDAMIVGVQKAGTSSLLGYLAQHPAILTHETAELDYFVYDQAYESRRIADYFDRTPDPNQVVLAKSATVFHTPVAVSRLYEHNPNCKLIIMLRNPVERAYSSFQWARSNGLENLSTFEDAVWEGVARFSDSRSKRNCDYLSTGLYAKWIHGIYARFSRNQVTIVLLEDLKESPAKICRELYHFLGVAPGFEANVDRVFNPASEPRSQLIQKMLRSRTRSKRLINALLPTDTRKAIAKKIEHINTRRAPNRPLQDETRQRLVEYYSEPNRELGELIGRQLDHWNR